LIFIYFSSKQFELQRYNFFLFRIAFGEKSVKIYFKIFIFFMISTRRISLIETGQTLNFKL